MGPSNLLYAMFATDFLSTISMLTLSVFEVFAWQTIMPTT